MQLLRRAGYSFNTTAEFEIVKGIKEKYCYLEPMNSKKETDFLPMPIKDKDTVSGNTSNCVLPDG
jgi:hypothetical protein